MNNNEFEDSQEPQGFDSYAYNKTLRCKQRVLGEQKRVYKKRPMGQDSIPVEIKT